MKVGWSALRRRLKATAHVWRPGRGHLALLGGDSSDSLSPDAVEPAVEETAEERLPRGSVDLPPAGTILAREPVSFRGWALFPSGPASKVELWLNGEPLGRARLGLPRPDVEQATGLSAGLVAGYEHVVDLDLCLGPAETAHLRVRATGPEGEDLNFPSVWYRVGVQDGETGQPRADAPARGPQQRSSIRAVKRSGELRLLVVTHRLDLGGAQLYLLDLLGGMHNERPFTCTVLSTADGPLRAPLEELGFRVHVSTPLPLDDAASYAGRVEELVAWAKPGAFDLVLVNTMVAFHGVVLASALGIPAVWAIHESYTPSMLWALVGDFDPKVRRRAEECLGQTAAALFEADATRRLYEPDMGPERCVTLPYGVDFASLDAARSQFDRKAARRRRAMPDDVQVVLCVGTIEPRKAQVPLVQAFGLIADRHPRARLVLVGARDDPYTRALEEYVATCSFRSRVEILPVLSNLGPWYGLSDLFVCASDVESLPRSVLESMAWGTPVVAAEVFGLPELIEDDETGWLFPTRDVRAMADAIDRALSASEGERQRIAMAARELVHERHALGTYASACRELFERVAAGEWPAVADAQAD